jgi:RecJ-like exonuclease
METRSLLKLSLIIAFLGTFALLLLSQNIEPKITKITNINEKMLDEWVKVSGRVVDGQDYGSLRIVTLEDDTASIDCVLNSDKNFSIGSETEITGKVIEYKGELEIEEG